MRVPRFPFGGLMRGAAVCGLMLGVLLCAWPVHAASLRLTWADCPEGGGLSLRQSTCNNFLAVESLVPSFELTTPVDSVIAMELVIDVISANASLPAWWHFEPGGCNAGALSANTDFSLLASCADPWNSNGTALVQAWWVGQPRGGANQARLIVTVAASSANMVTMEALTPYYATIIRLTHQHSVGPSACAGCASSLCLVLNSIQLLRLPGAAIAEVQLLPSVGTSNWAAWQSSLADCAQVPVRNQTWGAIKNLYR